MTQLITGWRAALSVPGVYKSCMWLLGAARSRSDLVTTHIRPVPGMRILDLGCGPASILAYLPDTVQYVGVDLSQAYIDAARARYGSRGEFHCLPVGSVASLDMAPFNLVMGLGVLHHLDDEQAGHFFSLATNSLHDDGRCLTVDPCFEPDQHPIARFLIRRDRGRNVRTRQEYMALARLAFSRVSQWVQHDRLRVPYTHHIMECWKI